MRFSLLTPFLALSAGLLAAVGTGCSAAPPAQAATSTAPQAESAPQDSSQQASAPGAGQVFNDMDLIKRGHRVIWRVDLNLPAGVELAHVTHLDGYVVTVEHPNNLVSVFDANSGTRLWSTVAGDNRGRAFEPIRIDDSLYVANEQQLFQYNINTGNQRERFKLPFAASTRPYESGSNLIFGGATGVVWAQRLDTAGLEWVYQLASRITGAPVLVDGGRVIVSDRAGNTVLLNDAGTKIWGARAHQSIEVPAAAAGLAAYVPSTDQALYGLMLSSGRDLWPAFRAEVPLDQPALADGSGVYVPVPGQKLVALDAVDGNIRWTFPEAARPVADDADRLLAIADQSLVLLNKVSGSLIDRVPSEQLKNVFVLANRRVLAVSENGRLSLVALK